MTDAIERNERQSFPRSSACLPAVFEFMDRFFARAAIPQKHRIPMQFVVEEWFTNLVKYSRGSARDILLELNCEGGRLMISLTDFDVERFDIRAVPDVDVTRAMQDRKPGGLGIHLLKRMVDDIGYDYVDGKSTTTFVKSLER